MSTTDPTGGPSVGFIDSWDLDEYSEQVGPWDVRLDKVSSGGFHSRMRFLKIPGITLYEEHWEHHVIVRGAPPEGLIMLGTNIHPAESDVRWCGQSLNERVFASAEGEADIDFIMPERGHDVVLLIEPELFEQALGVEARGAVNASRHLLFEPRSGAALIHTATSLLRRSHANAAALGQADQVADIRSDLFIALDNCFSNPKPETLSSSRRNEALQRALQHIESRDSRTTAWEVAQASGISQKTLGLIFKQEFNLTLVRYLATCRLNRCYHDLFHADPERDSVTSIALHWGFSHLGRFSNAFRQQFGELPSQTLGKARAHRPSARLAVIR